MSWLKNLKISTQLTLVGFVITLMLLVMGGIGYYAFDLLNRSTDAMVVSSELDSQVRLEIQAGKNILLRGNTPEKYAKYHEMLNDARKAVSKDLLQLESQYIQLGFSNNDLKTFSEEYDKMVHAMNASFLPLKPGMGQLAYDDAMHKADASIEGIDRSITAISYALAEKISKQVDAQFGTLSFLFVTSMLATILLAFLLILILGRKISGSIKVLTDATQKLASGDLRVRAPDMGDNELGQLATSFNQMTDNLSVLAAASRETNTKMIETLGHLKQAVATQVAGASEQASSINETTSAIQQIKTSSSITLDKSKHLGESADRTRQEGEKGLTALQQAVDGMTSIKEKVGVIAQTILGLSEHTQQIGETTAAVGSLAQQSKLLALNASIEAAKAGEAGKGFAVVAVEVKDLAEQSQQATTKVHKILQDIQHGTDRAVMATEEGNKVVDDGLLLVEKTGSVVNSLISVIKETVDSTNQIIVSLRQESGGIEQIAEAMEEINKATEQFSKTAQQTEEVMRQLSTLSEKVQDSVRFYKLKSGE